MCGQITNVKQINSIEFETDVESSTVPEVKPLNSRLTCGNIGKLGIAKLSIIHVRGRNT
jgi:hypothetical protein